MVFEALLYILAVVLLAVAAGVRAFRGGDPAPWALAAAAYALLAFAWPAIRAAFQ